jgi:hypothetical protein
VNPVPAALTTPRLANGYGPRAIPDPLDTELREFADEIVEPGPFAEARARLVENATPTARVLAVFGERMASLAVRGPDVGVLREGLTGTALACALNDDSREIVTPMSLLYRAAELIGADPDDEFAKAARRSGNAAAAEAFAAFTRRSAADKSPSAMYFVEGRDEDGFRFLFEDPYQRARN